MVNGITGVVLSGGRSSRFGQDKGLYPYKGKPLVLHALAILEPLCRKLMISTNDSSSYAGFGYECIADISHNAGPLAGIQSALTNAHTEGVAIISCDTPSVPSALYKKLINSISDYDVVMPVHDGFIETMCAVYAKKCLPQIEAAINSKQLRILDAIKPLDKLFLNIEDEAFYKPDIFHNINYKRDIR
jgi:molybdopterin-guanine dinucleotide biosynthesis protein A